MELKEIQELIKFVSKSGVTEVEIEKEGFKLVIKADNKHEGVPMMAAPALMPQTVQVAAPVMQVAQQQEPVAAPVAAAPATNAIDESKLIAIKSPMIGTFYRASSPDKEPFLQIGDMVEVGKIVCIIEAMKLFNEIESEVKGRVVKICVDNAKPVEYDQTLFLVEPA